METKRGKKRSIQRARRQSYIPEPAGRRRFGGRPRDCLVGISHDNKPQGATATWDKQPWRLHEDPFPRFGLARNPNGRIRASSASPLDTQVAEKTAGSCQMRSSSQLPPAYPGRVPSSFSSPPSVVRNESDTRAKAAPRRQSLPPGEGPLQPGRFNFNYRFLLLPALRAKRDGLHLALVSACVMTTGGMLMSHDAEAPTRAGGRARVFAIKL
ncbi:hypothetical protein V8C34DRAFT_134764 [Trichoderma compactum]